MAVIHPRVAGGRHLLADLWTDDPAPLRRADLWRDLLPDACRAAGATVLAVHVHQFEPEGATGIVLLAESHASVHTWPERGLVTLDVFTCGAMDAGVVLERVRTAVGAVRERVTWVHRGDAVADLPESTSARSADGRPLP